MYQMQKQKSRLRNHPLPDYTQDELMEVTLDMPFFHTLHDEWIKSDYDSDLKPSYDRIDKYLPYTKDNIQLMTWEENNEKGRLEKCKAIEQFTKEEVYITTYYSAVEAEVQTKVNRGSIARCCKFKRKTAGGFKWQYSL